MSFIKPRFDKPFDWWSAGCYFVLAVVIIAALVCCAWVFCHTVVLYNGNTGITSGGITKTDSLYCGSVSLDKYEDLPEDSVLTVADLRHILDTQKTLILRQDKMADDLRQESNNLINKMNGWLGFCIGLIAVIGALVPIALNYKQHHDFKESKREIDEIIRHSLGEVHKELRELHSRTNDADARMNKSISLMEKREEERIEASKNEIEEKWRGILFTKAVRDFHLVYECPSFQNSECRHELLQQIWKKILSGLHDLIRDYCRDSGGDFHKQATERLASGLILVSAVLEMIRKLQPRRQRKLSSINDRTIRLACQIINPTYSFNILKDQLSDYYLTLSAPEMF